MRKVIYASLVVSMFFASSCNKDSESDIKPVTALSKPQEILDKNNEHVNYKESEYTFILDPKRDNKNFGDSPKPLLPSKRSKGLDVTTSAMDGQVVASTKVKPQ